MVYIGGLCNYLELRLVVAVDSHGIVQRKIEHFIELTHVDCLDVVWMLLTLKTFSLRNVDVLVKECLKKGVVNIH